MFDLTRWIDKRAMDLNRCLLHFGVGHRMCIGKTIAMTNILKLTSTLLRKYSFQVIDKEQQQPNLFSGGVTEMEDPMLVTVKKRVQG